MFKPKADGKMSKPDDTQKTATWMTLEVVEPYPEPGPRHHCYSNSYYLFVKLRKDPRALEELRFVGFMQPDGAGPHFVVEDGSTVFDPTTKPGWRATRFTKTSYWKAYSELCPELPGPVVRIDNDQFQVLIDAQTVMREYGEKMSINKVLAMMMVIKGSWDGPARETEEERFLRLVKKMCPALGKVRVCVC